MYLKTWNVNSFTVKTKKWWTLNMNVIFGMDGINFLFFSFFDVFGVQRSAFSVHCSVFDNCESFSSTLLFNWIRLMQPFQCHNMCCWFSFNFRMVCGRRDCDKLLLYSQYVCYTHTHSYAFEHPIQFKMKEKMNIEHKERNNVSEFTNNYIVGLLRCQWILLSIEFSNVH